MINKSSAPVTQNTIDDFNDFLARTAGAVQDRDNTPSLTLHDYNPASAYLPSLTERELRDYLFFSKEIKSSGIDEIYLRDLRRNFEKLKNVLLVLLNDIIATGEWPTGMKTAIVKPLYKGGATNDFKNDRPILI